MTDHTARPSVGEWVGACDRAHGHGGSGGVTDLGVAYRDLASIALYEQPLGMVLRRICELAVQVVPGADAVSITMIERGLPRSVAYSGPLAVTLDERQYQEGFGPGMDAAITGQTIAVEDTAHNSEYPDFARQATCNGIRHTLSIGLPARRDLSGALNLYGAGAAGGFDQAVREIAMTFAGYVAIAVLNAAIWAGSRADVVRMHDAMASRAGIEQAKGIIMRERRCSADAAFDQLREVSSRTKRTLHEVAQQVVNDVVG